MSKLETTDMAFKPTITVEFDSVINPYSRGWQEGVLYEEKVVPGFWQWLETTSREFTVTVHSARFARPGGMSATLTWLKECYCREHGAEARLPFIKFAAMKPPSLLTIDARCVRFDGDWSDPALTVEGIRAFKPWNQR
jgi:hypothetical protein